VLNRFFKLKLDLDGLIKFFKPFGIMGLHQHEEAESDQYEDEVDSIDEEDNREMLAKSNNF